LDIRFLESFITVAESGSVAAAARRLGLTPAAVAQRLHRLEEDIGHSLVTRVGRTMQPTESGLAIIRHARMLVDSARDLRAIAANDQPEGRLRLGATASALTGLLPGIISRLSAGYPLIEYFVRPGSSLDLYQEVVTGDLDAAIIVQPPFQQPKSTGWLPLREEPQVLITPQAMPFENVHLAIQQHPFIRYDHNQWGGQLVDRYLRQHRLKVREWLELDALDAIAALVDRGLGVAIVPDWAPPWPGGLKLRKHILDDAEMRVTGVLWNKSGAQIAATRAFVDSCTAL
jgi:DNA-binding transcriptional LysR family regulator